MIRNALAALLLATFAASLPAAESDWPREIERGDGTSIVVYEPQPDSLDGDTLLSRSAVSMRRPGSDTPVFGAIETTATLDIDGGHARIVELSVDRVRFPGMREDSEAARELAGTLEREIPRWNLDLSMADIDRRLATQAGTQALRNTPPKFIYVDQPAILISIDGEPRLRAVSGTGLERVVNTPFPVVYDRASKRYYFYGSSAWFATSDLTRGRWTAIAQPPEGVAALFRDEARASPDRAGAAPPLPADQLRRARILVATEPTELISTDGRPAMQPLVGSELLTVSNTDSDLFFDVPGQAWYIVVSGRWYRARSLTGDWTFVESDQLPASFAQIPPSSPKADALAYVAGTDEANDAVLDASIPQVAAVDRRGARFNATYDGSPRFEPIPRTDLRYAVNTSSQVFLADGRYYAVEQGIWFIADSPYGPWTVSETRPVGLDDIPPSSPAYNTRYVHIYDVRPDVIYMGYTPGYLWSFPYAGTVVYGTGYRYRPWYGDTWYYPRPWTWGFSIHYSPWMGWNYGMSWNAGWIGLSWAWGDGWGQWRHGYRRGYDRGYRRGYWDGVHGGGWFGPGGYRPPVHAPRPPHYRPDARPVKGGGGYYATPRRPRDSVYAHPGNANLAATRPVARYWNAPSSGRVLRPSTSQRPAPPDREWRTRDERGQRDVRGQRDGRDERFQRDVWRPASPPNAHRPILRPAQPMPPAQPNGTRQEWRGESRPRPPAQPQAQPQPRPQPQIQSQPRAQERQAAPERPRHRESSEASQQRRERGPQRDP
ncbi:MAG: carbohydrate-binding family V/XII [Steroidobacteraceae bacterium]